MSNKIKTRHDRAAREVMLPVPVAPVARTSDGLRDVLFDEIDFVRNGKSSSMRANAVAKLVGGVVETVHMDLEVAKFAKQVPGRDAGLPPSLRLGQAA